MIRNDKSQGLTEETILKTLQAYLQKQEEGKIFPRALFHRFIQEYRIFDAITKSKATVLNLDFITMIRWISKEFPAFAAIMLTQACYGIYPVYRYGTVKQQEAYLQKLLSGNIIAGLGYSEGKHLEDLRSLETYATRTEEGWCLSGTKTIVSNAHHADLFLILAKVKEVGKKDSFGFFMIESSHPKLFLGEEITEPGLQDLSVSSVTMNNLLLPADSLLGGSLDGEAELNDLIKKIQLGLSAIALGIAEGAFEKGVEFARVKRGFGKRLIDVDVHQMTFANLYTKLRAAETYFASYDELYEDDALFVSQIKLFTTRVAVEVAEEIIRLIGPLQKLEDVNIERYLKDAETIEIYGKSGNSIRKRIAQRWVKE